MSILSDFEDRVAGTVEGVFAGVFRSPVQPAELARAAGREMDRRRKLGVGKVYAPTMYSVLLSPKDGENLGGFADTLAGELETYLTGHAREKGYELTTRPRVQFLVDDELRLGRFEVIGELLSEQEIEAGYVGGAEEDVARAAAAPVPTTPADQRPARVAPDVAEAAGPRLTATIDGARREFPLDEGPVVIGRLKSCDICLADANTSREHASLRREGAGWVLTDLGSTNGTLLNGSRVGEPVPLRDSDIVTVGTTELTYTEGGVGR